MERLMRGMFTGEPGAPPEPPPGVPAGAADAPEAPAGPALRFNRLLNPTLFAPVSPAEPAVAPEVPSPFVPAPSPGFPPGIGTLPTIPGFPPPRPTIPEPPPPLVVQPLPFPFFPPLRLPPQVKTATQLARSAIRTLDEGSADVVNDAVNTLKGRGVPGPELLDFLERRVRIGEVLNQMAGTWAEATGGDFAEAFQMDATRRDVMDAIVAIAILSDPQLDEEILVENTPQTREQDLLDNRVIVDQWPKGGSAMQPPYMILVAVEYRDVAQAEEIVRSIMDQLGEHEGYKLTRTAIGRLRSR